MARSYRLVTLLVATASLRAKGYGSQRCASLVQLNSRALERSRRSNSAPLTVELMVGSQQTGLQMPLIGFGTCCRETSTGVSLQSSIAAYLQHGGRLIDTAVAYQNHKDVGLALNEAFQRGETTRDQVWVTSKIPPSIAQTPEQAVAVVDKSLSDLGLEYVDLFLIHAPGPSSLPIWKGLMQAKAAGKIRAIGVSNFSPAQIQELEAASGERPSNNQIEFHPWVGDDVHANVEWCREHGVAITAYGSLGENYHHGLTDHKVANVAAKHDATPAQVLLRWALHQGVAVIPGATSEAHILEDLAAGAFDLSGEETSPRFFASSA